MTSPKELKRRIEGLDQERSALLKAHQTLMDIYRTKGTGDAKRRASTALDQAGKRERRIAELQAELKAARKSSSATLNGDT
jgi:hypothetical protein